MNKQQRSDQSLAVYGILVLAGVALVGAIVLAAMGKEDAAVALISGVVGVALGGVLGWARGGTYYAPDNEKIPTAPVTQASTVKVIDTFEVKDSIAPSNLPTDAMSKYPLVNPPEFKE